MITTLVAAVSLSGIVQADTVRYDFMSRLSEFEREWTRTTDEVRRLEAVTILGKSTRELISGRWRNYLLPLDSAIGALRGRGLRTESAITTRFVPSSSAKVRFTAYWSYIPANAQAISLKGTWGTSNLKPGEVISFDVEGKRPFEVRVGDEMRTLRFSDSFSNGEIPENLKSPTNEVARELVNEVNETLSNPLARENVPPLVELIRVANDLESKTLRVDQLQEIWSVKSGSTRFRVQFPLDTRDRDVDIVFGFAGAGFSQHVFFTDSPFAVASTLARSQKLVFVGMDATANPLDVYNWLINERKLRIGHIFAIGYSDAAHLAMSCRDLPKKSSAVALITPIGKPYLKSQANQPMLLEIGDKDLGAFLRTARNTSLLMKSNPDFHYVEFKNREHLTVVRDAMKRAMGFFMEIRRKGSFGSY